VVGEGELSDVEGRKNEETVEEEHAEEEDLCNRLDEHDIKVCEHPGDVRGDGLGFTLENTLFEEKVEEEEEEEEEEGAEAPLSTDGDERMEGGDSDTSGSRKILGDGMLDEVGMVIKFERTGMLLWDIKEGSADACGGIYEVFGENGEEEKQEGDEGI
jgi:hypothetical protein